MCKKAEMQFSVFLIHQLAQNWKKTPREVYQTLDSTHILDDYIINIMMFFILWESKVL